MIIGSGSQRAGIATLFVVLFAAPDNAVMAKETKRGNAAAKAIEFSGDYTIPFVINGKSARLKVAADGLKWPIFNSSLARAAELKSGPLKGKGKTEEGDQVTISSKIVRSQYGTSKKRQRALWSDRDDFTGVDGVVGPTGIGYEVVRMVLRAGTPDEHITTHPLRSIPLLGLADAAFEIEIAAQRITVSFNLERHDTLVNAATGKLLADHYGGALSGDPVSYALFNGKKRPGRRLVLEKPLLIDGLDVGDIAVRIRPEATSGIPDSTVAPDPDEVVVTANSKRKPRYSITLGTDYLKTCSSITYNLRVKTVALSCT